LSESLRLQIEGGLKGTMKKMKDFTFLNRITIQTRAADIYTYLMEPTNLTHLHPLIIDVKKLPDKSKESSRVEIQDKIIIFGIIPIFKKYEASFTAIKQDKQLQLETFTSPGIHITNTITLSETEKETLVEEHVLVEVPAWIAGFVMKQIRSSHGEMLQTLKKTLES
jgi:S-methylmethionine-dependent homocysteine/selenocysteine methylase